MAKCKIEIIRNGVCFAAKEGDKEVRLAIGTILTLDKEPTGWVGKYRVVGQAAKGSTLETGKAKAPNPALSELVERFAELGGEGAADSWGVPAYKKAIKAIEEANANAGAGDDDSEDDDDQGLDSLTPESNDDSESGQDDGSFDQF